MKRLFAVPLILMLLISFGCAAPKTNSGDNLPAAETNTNEQIVSHIQIKSGDNVIMPYGRVLWSKTDNGDGTFTMINMSSLAIECFVDEIADKIPTLHLEGQVTYLVQVNGSVQSVRLMKSDGNGYTLSEITFEALSELSDGTYYVVLDVLLGGNCNPDAPQNSSFYEDIFRLTVG